MIREDASWRDERMVRAIGTGAVSLSVVNLDVGAVISIYGSPSGDMPGGARVIFASSLDGNPPKVPGTAHPKYQTPHVAIISS